MTQIEKQIVKIIEDKFGFPYMTYDKQEQTWTNDNFLFDIKSSTFSFSLSIHSQAFLLIICIFILLLVCFFKIVDEGISL